MNKYKNALNTIAELLIQDNRTIDCLGETLLMEQTELEVLQELVDNQQKLKTIIKEYEIKLGNLKEYTQGHSLLNGLICDLKELIKGNENE